MAITATVYYISDETQRSLKDCRRETTVAKLEKSQLNDDDDDDDDDGEEEEKGEQEEEEVVVVKNPQQGDLRLSGPPSGQNDNDGTRTRNRRVPADIRADSLATEPPTAKLFGPRQIRTRA
ncbi:hypothetical protein PoB_001895400 [Plakobranchus ocellatus]|uniref:Uncharacterized protein n=1 Tax=Plakobranchus ocellatus TaxID=259542 RepID=A0AAV3ZDH8_9GAST|nr:hypothetical protein PoB_001895400 [Plakobranchus ocellatus]